MLQGSVKQNVLPTEARAVVNFRIHPADSVAGVLAHVESAVGDPRVELRRFGEVAGEPGPVSPASGPAYGSIARTIRQIYPEAIVAPSLSIGTTDARHYTGISDAVYRFVPIVLGPDDLTRFHGVDERIAVEEYFRMVRFYAQLIRNAAGRAGIGAS
jgi:carboxypeptidase PM20D1